MVCHLIFASFLQPQNVGTSVRNIQPDSILFSSDVFTVDSVSVFDSLKGWSIFSNIDSELQRQFDLEKLCHISGSPTASRLSIFWSSGMLASQQENRVTDNLMNSITLIFV